MYQALTNFANTASVNDYALLGADPSLGERLVNMKDAIYGYGIRANQMFNNAVYAAHANSANTLMGQGNYETGRATVREVLTALGGAAGALGALQVFPPAAQTEWQHLGEVLITTGAGAAAGGLAVYVLTAPFDRD